MELGNLILTFVPSLFSFVNKEVILVVANPAFIVILAYAMFVGNWNLLTSTFVGQIHFGIPSS